SHRSYAKVRRWPLHADRIDARRIPRILPALVLVLLSTTAVSVIVMLPPDSIRFGSGVIASVLFYSNFYFWAQKGNHLRDGLEFQPLLHTWSLAIEEQFYILFPLFMCFVWLQR